MPDVKNQKIFAPLGQALPLSERAYQALRAKVATGEIPIGAPLRIDGISEQLQISSTPVREALHRLEKDGLVVKVPYQGWFVRAFEEDEIRELYELRAGLECFGVRLACQRITAEELAWLREHQRTGEAALERGDMTAYWAYNRDFHAAILRAARNTHLVSTMGQLSLQTQVLTAHTIRFSGRPTRGLEEHGQLVALLGARDAAAAERLLERHILSALEDILRHRSAEQGVVQGKG